MKALTVFLPFSARTARLLFLAPLLGGAILAAGAPAPRAADEARDPSGPARIGIYDSRAVAYAHFWDEGHQAALRARVDAARTAKEKGDTAEFQRLNRALQEERDRLHLQVFSTAPIDEVLASMAERVRAVEREAGVSRLVSRWDEEALRRLGAAEKVDVTAKLVAPFQLAERRRRVLNEIATRPPLPLARARELAKEGKL